MTNSQMKQLLNETFNDLLVTIPKTPKQLKNKLNTIFNDLKVK